MNGLATVTVFWSRGAARGIMPPRVLVTGFGKGMALGQPEDEATHRAVLMQALEMLSLESPHESVWET